MCQTSNIFGPSGTTIEGFGVSLNYLILNFKKTVCPKNIWMGTDTLPYCSIIRPLGDLLFKKNSVQLINFTFLRLFDNPLSKYLNFKRISCK